MAEKEKKRKRPSEGTSAKPNKRQALSSNDATVKVIHEDGKNQLCPVLGMEEDKTCANKPWY